MNFKTSRMKPFGALVEPVQGRPHVDELNLADLRELFLNEQIVVLRGFETFPSAEEFSRYCERWGQISVWPFGKVLELVEQEDPKDHIFDHSYVPLHWDGMYRPQVPEYQIFQCVKAPLAGQGGRTTFANTILALRHAPPQLRRCWEKVTGVYKRRMEFYDSVTTSPIIARHPRRDFSVIRYNEPPSPAKGRFVNPPELKFEGVHDVDLERFHQQLQAALYAEVNFYAHEWQKDDIVITDNFSLLHGREAYASKSPRHLRRVQVLSDPPFDNPGLESYR